MRPLVVGPGKPSYPIGKYLPFTLRGDPQNPLGAFLNPCPGSGRPVIPALSLNEGAALRVEGVSFDTSTAQQDCINVFNRLIFGPIGQYLFRKRERPKQYVERPYRSGMEFDAGNNRDDRAARKRSIVHSDWRQVDSILGQQHGTGREHACLHSLQSEIWFWFLRGRWRQHRLCLCQLHRIGQGKQGSDREEFCSR
jgi:hypothetical protein